MTQTPPFAPCPRCGETQHITRLPNDPGEAGEIDQCQACDYIYEDGWQAYPWLQQPGG